MAYLYILKCNKGKFYTGSTLDIERRLYEHQAGIGAKYIKYHLPVKLVFLEEFSSIEEAFYKEQKVKKWSHKKKIALINSNFELLHELSKCKNITNYLNYKK